MIVHECNYLKLVYQQNLSLIEHFWLASTEMMTDEEYRKTAEIQVANQEKYKAKFWFIDVRFFKMVIDAETQNWADEVLFPRMVRTGVQKIAFLANSKTIVQMSIEQLMAENFVTRTIQSCFFYTPESAYEWFLK